MYRYKIINKKRFYLFVISFLISILFSGFFVINATALNKDNFNLLEEEIYVEKILIKKGDTLWNIALEYKDDYIDVRDMVEMIKDLNNLKTSEIYIGNIIKIPIRK